MLRISALLSLVLLLVPSTEAKDKSQLPKLVVTARFVLVTTYFGDQPASSRIMPDDLQAVGDVQDSIKKWGRYTVVYRREDADLILLVRKGRVAEALTGVHIPLGTDAPNPSIGTSVNADAGDPQDMIAIYQATRGIDSPPLWRARQMDGLKAPKMRLVQDLRTQVEAAEKVP
jgi:hypothetical protein